MPASLGSRWNNHDLVAHRRVERAEIAACENNVLGLGAGIACSVRLHRLYTGNLRLRAHDRDTLTLDSILIDPGSQYRCCNGEGRWSIGEVENDSVDQVGIAGDNA